MFCPQCRTEYVPEARWCSDCGAQLVAELAPLSATAQPALPSIAEQTSSASALPTAAPVDNAPIANSSGTGLQAWTPKEAQGWTFAGFIPLGLFALSNNITSWGLLALACSIIPFIGFVVLPICWIYIGINGKKLAWKLRKFESREQFKKTMTAWDTAGGIIFAFLLFSFVILAYGFISDLNGSGSN